MNVNIRTRFIIFAVIAAVMFGALFVKLFQLTVVEGEDYRASADALAQREITVSGARGSILDQSGLPLAYDQKSYNVQFYRDPTQNTAADRAYYTGIIISAIDIIEGNNGETLNDFAIKHQEDTGKYYFDFGLESASASAKREKNWRANMYISNDKWTAEQIYLYLRDKYQIPEEMDFDQAAKILSVWQDVQLNAWVAYEPITVAEDVSVDTVAAIETHAAELRGMSIAESTTRIYPRGSVAAHVIGYEGRITEDILNKYTAEPDEAVVTGITGRMSEDVFKTYDTPKVGGYSLTDFGFTEDQIAGVKTLLDLGYSVDNLIGVEGIEKSMEAYLTGNTSDRQGKQEVEVDNMAVVQNVLSSTEPMQGYNVMLTMDTGLQLVAEQALANEIPQIYAAQVEQFNKNPDTDPYDDKIGDYTGLELENLHLACSGAAIVVEVDTGNVLALANYPSYDLNQFTGGISDEDYKKLTDMAGAPLFNKAIQSLATPGSIFKMVTATAALMEGKTNLTETIDCDYRYTEGISNIKQAPHCWTKNAIANGHINQTVVEGLQNSCNFYFYTMAGRLGIDLIDKWGDKYGLTSSTGIELPGEQVGIIGNQELLYDSSKPIFEQANSLPGLVYETGKYSMVNLLKDYADKREIEYPEGDTTIADTAKALVQLMGINWTQNPETNTWEDPDGTAMGVRIRSILSDMMDIRTNVSHERGWDSEIASVLLQLRWTKYLTVTTGIGQGITEVTPIAVARYIAAIANGGTVYQAHIVDKVLDQDGNVVFDQQPEVFAELGADEDFIAAIQKGMSNVVSAEEGTAHDAFKNFPSQYLSLIAGKTGTAQVSTVDLENNSWFVCFAPYAPDDPEKKPQIAVVVYIPNGYKGTLSSLVAQDILKYWFERQEIVAQQTIPGTDSLIH